MKRIGKKMKENKGFTLIELIVVIAIIGILLALAIPRLIGYTETAKESADEQLAALYQNTFNVLVSSGQIKNNSGGNVTIKVTKDGDATITGDLQYRDAATGAYLETVTNGSLVEVSPSPASSADDAPKTLVSIQLKYLAKNGRGNASVPTFDSKMFQYGIQIIITENNEVELIVLTSAS